MKQQVAYSQKDEMWLELVSEVEFYPEKRNVTAIFAVKNILTAVIPKQLHGLYMHPILTG